jgi:leader peptidase (prepilin peptidase) / N-methyltransferase
MVVLWLVLLYVFVLGLAIGSFLNVCVARLPYEKSLLWPGSHCPLCWQPIRMRDNIPVVSFLLLRGRCRSCGCRISWRYPLVELLTGFAFTGLYYLEMVANVHDLPILRGNWRPPGLVPWEASFVFLHHLVLLSFLIVVSLCDLNDMEIPLPITVTGTLVGLLMSTFMPWPYPEAAAIGPARDFPPYCGAQPWPVWYPLPEWLPAGGWRLGLATALAGALAGMLVLRGVRFLFGLGRGIEGLGVGDADLMMMAGAFIGWQPIVLAFFVAVFPGLIFAIVERLRTGGPALPFGPSLALGVVITLLLWPRIGPNFQMLFFDPLFLAVMFGGGAAGMLVLAFVFRLWSLLMRLVGGAGCLLVFGVWCLLFCAAWTVLS